MALATYTDLITEVGNSLHRADLASRVPVFVTLAEHRIFSDLNSRYQDTVTTLTCTASTETISLPSDFINARTVVIVGQTPNVVLDYKSPDQYQAEFPWGEESTPQAYTIIGSSMYLAPIPDSEYTIRLAYQQRVPSLAANETNWLMTNFPAVYLYATLSAACADIKDGDAMQKWEALYHAAINGVNAQDWASMATMRVKSDVRM